MADKVRGALNQIDWSKSNQVSINVDKRRQEQQKQQEKPAADRLKQTQPPATSAGDIPVNQYRSIVAPVKSVKDEEKVVMRRDQGRPQRNRQVDEESEQEEDVQVYLGYLGSIRVPKEQASTGIMAIQAPMRGLYFPYRDNKAIAQERVISVASTRLEVYYMPHPDAEEPETLVIDWNNILYVEPLRFSTKKPDKDKKTVRAAFEPCESQRLAMLGNRHSLFTPISKQHKHISLLKHPALLCMVVLLDNELYTHGYICSTVEEAVFLARKVRDKLEVLRRESLRAGQLPPPMLSNTSTRSDSSYKIVKSSTSSSQSKQKSKNKSGKKKEKGTYSTHTGTDAEDLGAFHFGLLTEPSAPLSYSLYESTPQEEEIRYSMNENFMIGRSGVPNESRQKSRHSTFSEMDAEAASIDHTVTRRFSSESGSNRPVGVVQPAVRDGFKVLPSDLLADKAKLKPTMLNVKNKRQSDITPELDLKLRLRQAEQGELELSPLAPRSVVNPLADVQPEQTRKSYISPAPGPISKMSASLPFNPTAALPESSWHEAVIGNFVSKEEIQNRLNSQMVDTKQLPKMKSDKKEQEMANLFSNVNIENVASTNLGEDNIVMSGTGPTSQLHEAMGFLP